MVYFTYEFTSVCNIPYVISIFFVVYVTLQHTSIHYPKNIKQLIDTSHKYIILHYNLL